MGPCHSAVPYVAEQPFTRRLALPQDQAAGVLGWDLIHVRVGVPACALTHIAAWPTVCRYYVLRHSLHPLKDVGLLCFKGEGAWGEGAGLGGRKAGKRRVNVCFGVGGGGGALGRKG